MSFWKKETKAPVHTAPAAESGDIAADVAEVMKKYDRESNTRVWEGMPQWVVRSLMVLFSVYSIYVTLFSTALPEFRLSVFLASIIIMGYLNFPMFKHHVKPNSMPWYDAIIMVLGAGAFFYYAFNAERIIKLSLRAAKDPLLLAVGVIGILVLIELCRRSVGLPILCVVGALLVYTFTQVQPKLVIYNLFYTTSGVMNTPTGRTCSLRIALHVHGRYANEENILEQLVDIDGFCFRVVVFFKIDNRRNAVGAEIAGHSAVFASESAEFCHIVLNEGRKGSAEDFFLFLFESRFACVSVAYEGF